MDERSRSRHGWGFIGRVTSPSTGDAPVQPGTVVVPVPSDAAARAALTARVTTLSAVRHPHLVGVLDVRTVRDGALDVVLARGEAADLPTVLAVRGRLAAGEAAAVGVHVAQALAALHAAGLVHGPLEPADVVLRPGGAPALRPRAATPPEEWTPAEDVRAVARLVDGLLGSRPVEGSAVGGLDGDPLADPDGALRAVLAPALGADARRRPEAGTLAALLDAACEPATVRLPDPATLAGAALAGGLRAQAQASRRAAGSSRRFRVTRRTGPRAGSAGSAPARRSGRARGAGRGRARSPRRRLSGSPSLRPVLVVIGVGLTVGAMTGAALQWRDARTPESPAAAEPAPQGTSHPAPSAEPVRDEERPADAAAALTQRRLDLLADPGGDLTSVDLAGSPAFDADAALLAELERTGVRPLAPRATFGRTITIRGGGLAPGQVRVRVEYVVEAHDQVAQDGTRTAVPSSGPQTATLDLQWTEDGWRVSAVA